MSVDFLSVDMCMCGFCKVWVCVCVDFVKYGCVCMCGFCKVWVCVCVDFVKCGCVYVCGFFKCGYGYV